MPRNPFADPFTSPAGAGSSVFGREEAMAPAVPRLVPTADEIADADLSALAAPEYGRADRVALTTDTDDDDDLGVPQFESPYKGQDLLSEPMDKEKGPTAFQRKEVNWEDGGEDLTRPRLRDVAAPDWLEVDYMYGKKEGASTAPVEAANVFGRQFTRAELESDEDGRNLLALMEYRRSGKVNEGGSLANFGKGFADWGTADIPFYGWFADIGTTVGDAIEMSRTIRKLQDGDKVSNREAIRLRTYMLRQELEGQRTMAHQVGSTVRSSVTLGAEILASSAIGAGIGAMFGGVGAPVGAAVGALFAPVKWLFGVGGAATKAAARKVVNVGMKQLASKAVKDLTAAELKTIFRTGAATYGEQGVRSLLREGVKRGLRGHELYQSLAAELQYATKMADPTRMATRALFSADYRLALEGGLRAAVEQKAMSKMLVNATKKEVAALPAKERAKLVNEGIRKMIADNEWKPFVQEFSKGVMMGDKVTAADFVRRGVQEATGRNLVAPQYAQRMLDIVAGNVAKDMELAAGKLAFANPVRFLRYFGEHAARGLVQSEHGLFGGAPTIAHSGFTTFAKGSDALKEGFGRVFIEAPIQGALQFAGGPLALSPVFALASGHSPTDLTVKGQLGFQLDALIRGDREKMDMARMAALGSAFVEYASEAAGRGIGSLAGGAVATVLNKSPKAIAEGAKAMTTPISRKVGAALDRAVKAVYGEGDLVKSGVEGFTRQAAHALRGLTGQSGVRASIARAVQNRTIDGFDDATKAALARKGVRDWKGFQKFVAASAADGNRVRAGLNYFGLKLMERGMTPDRVVQFFRQAGYSGILEEMGEERVGDFMRGLFGFDDTASDATWKDKLRSMFSGISDFDQLATEFIAFAIPGAIRRGTISAQSWLANGAVGQARSAAQGLRYMTDLGHGRVYAAVGGVTQEDKERLERHPEESRRMRDGVLGTTEANRGAITANAATTLAGRDGLVQAVKDAGGLSETGVSPEERSSYEAVLAPIAAAQDESQMKAAMSDLADTYIGAESEAQLETLMEQTGASVIFGDAGADAIRREWRKGAGHEFAADSDIERSLSDWKAFDAQKLTVTRREAGTVDEAVDTVCAQIAGIRRSASVSADEEDRANGEVGAMVADENARDVAVEDAMTLGRYLGRGAVNANAKMGFGRRVMSRVVGMLGAASTGDLSLAVASPAAWLARDEGVDKNLQMALLRCYSAGLMSGWAKMAGAQSDDLRRAVGSVSTPEQLRQKLDELRKAHQVSDDIFDQIEEAGEETFRARVTEFMTAYMTASGVALVTRQDALDMARSIVAKRHERAGESFERNDEWYAREDISREVEAARADVVEGVIATVRNAVGYTTHRGQGDYGTYMTVDVAQAIRNGTSAEVLAAVLDSPAFRGVTRVQNVSGLSEHEREMAMSLLTSDTADLGAIAAIETEGEVGEDGVRVDRELTERELAEVNSVMHANPSDYTPEAFQNLARTFVRRVKLTRENMRSTFSRYDEDGERTVATIAPAPGGMFDVVETNEATGESRRSSMGGGRGSVEAYLVSQGYAAEEQRLVIAQVKTFASSDATSLVFMRSGQDREAVRELFRNADGVVENEDMLPPWCRKEQREPGGPMVWKYDENESDVAAEAFRSELALADEYERNGESWRFYLAGTGASAQARRDRMALAKKMHERVYGAEADGGMSVGYESRARDLLEKWGIRRSSAMGTNLQQIGLAADAYVMPVDAVNADNVVVLTPDYFALGHGEALLRHGIRHALNAYVAGTGEEAMLRNELLLEAWREFRQCADEIVEEAESAPGGVAEAKRLRGVFDELFPPRATGPSTLDLAKIASSSIFYSCDRGNYEEGNGFLHSVELSRAADRFRSTDIFMFFMSAVDEALGGNGLFDSTRSSVGGLARYRPAFAPDFARLREARKSAAFGGASGEMKNPFIRGFRLRDGLTADEVRSGAGKWVVPDNEIGVKGETSDRLRVREFSGKLGAYWGLLADSGQRFAQAYGTLAGQKDAVLTSARAFEMARRSDLCGGEMRAEGAETRARMSDTIAPLARRELRRLADVLSVADITPASLECAGQALRSIATSLMAGAKDRGRAEAALAREFEGWLLGRGVSKAVAAEMVAAFDRATLRPIRRKTDEEAKNEEADAENAETEEIESRESTNDPDHERRVGQFVNDQNIIAVSGFLKFIMPAECGDSSPTFLRLRYDLARPEMYGELKGERASWQEDVDAFTRMLSVNSDLRGIDKALAANRVNLSTREDTDRMLDRVATLLWENGHRDYALAVAAIRNVDPANGERSKMLERLSQATATTPMRLVRSDRTGRFEVDFIGSGARADVVPGVVASGYTSLAESVLKGVFRPDGSLAKDAGEKLAKLAEDIVYKAFAGKYVDPAGMKAAQLTKVGKTDVTFDPALYDTLSKVADGKRDVALADYTNAVLALADVCKERMAVAANVLDSILGTGNQYSHMLRSPHVLSELTRVALAAYNMKGDTAYGANTRRTSVMKLVRFANYLVAGNARGKVSWPTSVQLHSGIVEDLVVEPVLGLVRRLGANPAQTALLPASLTKALEGRDADWVRATLRQMAKDKLATDMHLDLGATAAEAYANLNNKAAFVPGAWRGASNLEILVDAYLAGAPRSSATVAGRAANAVEGAKNKSVQTLPSMLPGFIRFSNSLLCQVSGAGDELAANGNRWRDGSNPIVSFVGAKDSNGQLVRRESVAGVLRDAINAENADPEYVPTHVLVPFFRADKPACYALRIPVATARAMIDAAAKNDEVLQQLPADLVAAVKEVAGMDGEGLKGDGYVAYKQKFHRAAYALAASALGQSQIDPKRVPVLSSCGPLISTYVDEGAGTDPRAGCYFVSMVGGVTGASMMGGYITAGVLPSRVSGMGEGSWSQAQKLHMFSVKRGVNFKKGQASAIGLGFYADGRSDDRSRRGEIVSNHAVQFAQRQGRRQLEALLSQDFKDAGLSGQNLLDPVPPLEDGATDEKKAEHAELERVHDAAVDIANEFLSKATVAVDDLETNKAGIFGSSCGLKVEKNATSIKVGGVTVARLRKGEWKSAVPGFEFDFDNEGIKKGKALVMPLLAAVALRQGGTVNAADLEGTWVRPDGSEFTGKLGDSGLLADGETLSCEVDPEMGTARVVFFTRDIYGQVVASNANSSKASDHHVFPTNATRDHWMMEAITNATTPGGRNGSRRFMDAHAGFSLLRLATLAHNGELMAREMRKDQELVALLKKHPNDNQVRDALSDRARAFLEKQTLVGYYGNHGIMVPSGGKLVAGDEFAHTVKIEWAPGTTDYDKGCYKPATVYTAEEAEAFGSSRSWASGSVNADVDGFRYGLYFDEAALDRLLAAVEEDKAAVGKFEAAGVDAATAKRMAKVAAFLEDIAGPVTTPEQEAKRAAFLDCAYDYTGRKASENARKDIRFDDLFYRTWDGEYRFDYAAFDHQGRTSLHDGAKHLYLGGSVFHAHRSPSGNIAAACGTVRATCPYSFFPDGKIGTESKYALDPVTTATQGSDMDGDSASLQFYDYGADDLVDAVAMRRFTDLVLGGSDPFDAAKVMGWTVVQDGMEVVDPRVFRSVARLVFVAQASNYREAATFHQGYTSVAALAGAKATGADFARYYRDHAPEGMEFADYGFAGRHPVGTDAVFGEPFGDETLARFLALAKKAVGKMSAEFTAKWFVPGQKMNAVLEAVVDELRGKPRNSLLKMDEAAGASDAASDSAKARGISVATQSTVLRALVTDLFQADRQMTYDEAKGYSAVIDLVAHIDGVSNNLFDTLKKMFATRAGWTTSMLPFFLGRLAVDAREEASKGNPIDSAFVLAEAVNFLEELTRGGKGPTVTVAGRLSSLLDPVTRDRAALRLAELYNKGAGKKDQVATQRRGRNRPADDIIRDFCRVRLGDEAYSMNRDAKVVYAAAFMTDAAHPVDEDDYEVYRRVADATDDSKHLCRAVDYMKVAGKGLTDVGRAALTAQDEESDGAHPLTGDAIGRDPALRLQDLVVKSFADQAAKWLDSTETLQLVLDGQLGRRPWDFASGSALRDNADRFVHLVGIVRNIDPAVVTRIATRRVTEAVTDGSTIRDVEKDVTTTETLLRRIATTAAMLRDVAASRAPKSKENVPLARLFAALKVGDNGVSLSLASRETSADIEVLRDGFDRLAGSLDRYPVYERDADGNAVNTGIKVTGQELAKLLVLHASLTGTFGAAQDYVTQSNLPAVFGDRRLRDLEAFRSEMLNTTETASALGLAPIDVAHTSAYDLFGEVEVIRTIGRAEAEAEELPYLRKRLADAKAANDYAGERETLRRGKAMKRDLDAGKEAFQSFRTYPALAVLRGDAGLTRYGEKLNNALEARIGSHDLYRRWMTTDPFEALRRDDAGPASVSAADVGLAVEEQSARVDASRVDLSWADPLETRTAFRRPGESEDAAVFPRPALSEDGSEVVFRTDDMVDSLEKAYNGLLEALSDAGKSGEARMERKRLYNALNPSKKFLTNSPSAVARDLADILGEAARRDPALYDALDQIGDRLVRHPDARVAAAINIVNSRLGSEGRDGVVRQSVPATRASFMGGEARRVQADTRSEFAERAERMAPGFTAPQTQSVKAAVKGAFETAFNDAEVSEVQGRDGGESNLLRITRRVGVGNRAIVTYVAIGSRMGDALGADAAADSVAELLNRRNGGSLKGADVLRMLGAANVTRLADVMRRTGGQTGESDTTSLDFAPFMSGVIRLSDRADFTTLFHEYYHQMVAVYRKLGILDPDTERKLNEDFGGEEGAAETFGRYLSGVEAGATDVELRDFLKSDGLTDEHLRLFEGFRRRAADIARGMFRGVDADGEAHFVALRIIDNRFTEEEALRIAEPSAADVANLERQLQGLESRPRLDVLTDAQMADAASVKEKALAALLSGDAAALRAAGLALLRFEQSIRPSAVQADTTPGVEREARPEPAADVDISRVSSFIRKALARYAKDGIGEDFAESMRLYREFPVTGDAASGPNAALFYTVRSFIAHVAEAENIAVYKADGTLTPAGEKLMSSEVVGSLALRFVSNATAERLEGDTRPGVEWASSAWAFSRALQTVAPGTYARYCKGLARKSADAFRRLGDALLARPGRTQEDVDAANEFLAKSREVEKFVDAIAKGMDIRGLLPFKAEAGGNLHGLFMAYFTGGAGFQKDENGDYLYPKGPVRPYSRTRPHTSRLSAGDAAYDPLLDLAYNYAAQAFSVAEAARSYRDQVLGRGKDEEAADAAEQPEGTGAPAAADTLTEEENAAVEAGLAEALPPDAPLDVNASPAPSDFYSRVDTTLTAPEWILANPGQWLASDMQKSLSGASMRDMMTDHTVRAVTERHYRLAMDWVQFFGMDTHVGDGVRKVEVVESKLGRNEQGDFTVSDANSHSVLRFSNTRGALFGAFAWQEKRVGEPLTVEDLREIHAVGRLVKLIANRQSADLLGIEVNHLAVPGALEMLRRDDYADFLSRERLLQRVADSSYRLNAVEDLLRRLVDDVPKSVLDRGFYSAVVEALRAGATKRGEGGSEPSPEAVNENMLAALERAGVVHRSKKTRRAVVCVSTKRMLEAWDASGAKRKLEAAGRPAQMLNPYYWADRFAKSVRELNDAASKSSYLSLGTGSRFTLAGTNRFWWHGGTGSHKFQVDAYQNAIKAFEGMSPSDVAVLRAKQGELYDIIEASRDPAVLRRRAFSEKGVTRLSDRELRYLAYLMGVTDRAESRFDVAAFARDIAAGRYERLDRDLQVPCTIRRDATVLDIRLQIAELVSQRTFSENLAALTAEQRQDYLNAQTAADELRETLSREMPGRVVARSEMEEFDRTGRLGDSRTAAESLVEMCKELTTAERFRGCLAQMLAALSADGTPAFVVAPTDAALGVDRMPDEYWGALARHVVRYLGRKMPVLSYDEGLSGAENMRRIHRQLTEGKQDLYGKMSTSKYGGERLFQGDILCRLDDRDAAGNVDEATRALGGEAACYMKQLLSTLRAPTQNAAWRVLDTMASWSKISSVGFSAFFQIATAFESPSAAVGFLRAFAGQAEWIGKLARKVGGMDEVFTRDLVRLLNTNDPFMTEARELCDLVGMPLDPLADFTNDPNDSNPVLGHAQGVKRQVEGVSAFAERHLGGKTGKAVRKVLEFGYRHPTDYTFNVILNGVKMAVVMQTVRRLREECLKGGRPFDLVKEMRKYGSYVNAEIGGIDPARYAWATPGMRKLLSLGMFSWQWTVGAWSAGGGEAVSDLIFGGHASTKELRRHALLRWIRMFGIVKFGVPAVLQASIKLLSMLGLKALPPDPDDPEGDSLETDVDEMPWWTFNNESKAGMLSFDVTPLLKLAARVPGVKELKRADVPYLSWAVPAYVGGGRNTTGKRHYYMHFGKQSDEFWRWFENPLGQFASKLSIPLQKGIEGFFGNLQPNGFSKGFAEKTMVDRWFNLSLDPDQSALANFVLSHFMSFSVEGMKANADAGLLAAVGPMRMGQSKRSTMLRIQDRLQRFAEDDRTGNPWSSRKNRRKFNLMCTDILREAQLNGVDVSTIVSSAIGKVASREYQKFFEAFPPNLDGAPDFEKMQDALRGLTRLDRESKTIRTQVVEKFKGAGTDVKKHKAYWAAMREMIRATQTSPVSFDSAAAERQFDAYLLQAKRARQATQLDENGGEALSNFLATDDVPETLYGVEIVTDDLTEEDREFFEAHPEAGGFYDTDDEGPEPPPDEPPPTGAYKAGDSAAFAAANPTLMSHVKDFEKLSLDPYPDIGGYAIGYGAHTAEDGSLVTADTGKIDEATADRLLARDLMSRRDRLSKTLPNWGYIPGNARQALLDVAMGKDDILTPAVSKRLHEDLRAAGEDPKKLLAAVQKHYYSYLTPDAGHRKGLMARRVAGGKAFFGEDFSYDGKVWNPDVGFTVKGDKP